MAQGASRDAGGTPVELLGDLLGRLADAASSGRRLDRPALERIGAYGRMAAEQGVPLGQTVELYVSAAWRLWRQLPAVANTTDAEQVRQAGEAVLRVVNVGLASLADGYLAARRLMVRREEELRRELIDDLLRGDPDVAGIVERAEPFGLDLARPHQLALALPGQRLAEFVAATGRLERVILDRFGDREVLVAAKDGMLILTRIAATRQTLADTTQALRRIAEGTYGRCERCEADIPVERLEIRPHARHCVPCQQSVG